MKRIKIALIIFLMFFLCSCEFDSHVHKYDKAWTQTETHHYHKATCEHTDQVSNYAEHIFGEWEEVNDNQKVRTCSVCNYQQDQNGTSLASEGLEYEYNKSTDSYSVSGIGTCNDLDIVIPPSYQGKKSYCYKC